MLKSLNTASMVSNFTVNGTSIQDDTDTNINGNYTDDGTIEWYNGTGFYWTWTRSNDASNNQTVGQNVPDPNVSNNGNIILY